MPSRPAHTDAERTAPAIARRAVRRAAILAALAALLAVGGVALGRSLAPNDAEASPAGTVRAFLTDAVIERNGVVACRYLTPAARQRVEATTSPKPSCSIALMFARLRLGGRSIAQESAVKQLDYRVEEHGGRARVTVAAGAAGESFGLRRATADELREFQAPPTHWRIDSGVDRLVAGA
jgi:hypothetical protein